MAKKGTGTLFVCSECGNEYSRWGGQCPVCGGWNTLKEVNKPTVVDSKSEKSNPKILSKRVIASEVGVVEQERISTGWKELDRVLGGYGDNQGLVGGAVILITGEPGVGKSTLLTQLVLNLAKKRSDVLYVSGEESVEQVGMRMKRVNNNSTDGNELEVVSLISTDNVLEVLDAIREKKWGLVVVDSIQTMLDSRIAGGSGSVTQIKECAVQLIAVAKEKSVPLIMVGHVTKDGSIAGPRLLEHMVDVVLNFEGDRQTQLRILRGIKNRFGATDEVGVFVMENNGLEEESNPSDIFVNSAGAEVPGSMLALVMEGSRPLVVEIQALVSVSQFPMPRRVVSGYDYNRVLTLIAVLMQRCGQRLENKDVYVNVVGGISLDDPGADLAIAVAIVSSVKNKALSRQILCVGEIGLSGEVRRVKDLKTRVKEGLRLGYKQILGPVDEIESKEYSKSNYLRDVLRLLGLVS